MKIFLSWVTFLYQGSCFATEKEIKGEKAGINTG